MGFFDWYYYGKAGKRDYSEQDMPRNRVSLFFLVLKDHFFDLIKVNLLQLVFWLPFLIWTYINVAALMTVGSQAYETDGSAQQMLSTMNSYLFMWLIGLIPCVAITGPSSAGAAYVMRNWARDQHAFLFSDFKDAFKSNWKQAVATSALTSVVPVLFYTAVSFYGSMASSNIVMFLPMILVFSMTLMWALMLPLLYPLMIGYELKLSALIKNAFLMAAASLPRMLLARLITFIPVAILLAGLFVGNGVVILVISLYYIFFGFAFSKLVYASFANGVFDQYINPHIKGAQVGMGLRPHMEEDDLLDDDDEDEEDDLPGEEA